MWSLRNGDPRGPWSCLDTDSVKAHDDVEAVAYPEARDEGKEANMPSCKTQVSLYVSLILSTAGCQSSRQQHQAVQPRIVLANENIVRLVSSRPEVPPIPDGWDACIIMRLSGNGYFGAHWMEPCIDERYWQLVGNPGVFSVDQQTVHDLISVAGTAFDRDGNLTLPHLSSQQGMQQPPGYAELGVGPWETVWVVTRYAILRGLIARR
jgi:hypothetical protein